MGGGCERSLAAKKDEEYAP